MGSRRPSRSWFNPLANYFVSNALGKTGTELMLQDNQNGQTPLLVTLSLPGNKIVKFRESMNFQ